MFRYAASAGLHALAIGAMVLLSRPPAGATPRPVEQVMPIHVPVPVRIRRPQPAELPTGPAVPAAPAWSSSLAVPDLVPTTLPSTLPVLRDLLDGVGSARTIADSITGATAGAALDLATADEVDDPVSIVDQPAPRYPVTLVEARIAGRVVLQYVVDTLGRAEPASIRVVSSTHPAFEAAARGSILASRFRPARLHGRVVRQLVRQTLSFRLDRR